MYCRSFGAQVSPSIHCLSVFAVVSSVRVESDEITLLIKDGDFSAVIYAIKRVIILMY